MFSPFHILDLQRSNERLQAKYARLRAENEYLLNLLSQSDESTKRLRLVQEENRKLKAEIEDLRDDLEGTTEVCQKYMQDVKRYETFLKNAFHAYRDN